MNQIRLNVQARLQFLSFVYSTLGSPRDFELTRQHVEILWDSLIQFNDLNTHSTVTKVNSLSIKDDLFNWFSSQAKNKDQHAVNIETFKIIFINKMPYLDPNQFSQTALHLYQELFKIYKYSYNQLQSQQTAIENLNNKQIESAAIDYIWKLAFKSSNKDVSLAAIQFLNSHYIQTDNISNIENENQFIDRCMCYLMNEAYTNLLQKSILDVEANLAIIERGLLLIKNHLDSFQRRHSYQLRIWQFKYSALSDTDELNKFVSHSKLLKQIRLNTESAHIFNVLHEIQPINSKSSSLNQLLNTNNNVFINLICQINPTQLKSIIQSQFKFTLKISTNETIGDLRAILREILIRTIKSNQPESEAETSPNSSQAMSSYSFVNNHLVGSSAHNVLTVTAANNEIFKSLLENEDEFYIKIFSNGQELTTASLSNSMLMDSKLISDVGLKDMQSIYINILSRPLNVSSPNLVKASKSIDKNCIPMIILSNEINFSNLFELLNLISSIEFTSNECQNKKRTEFLSTKLWEVMMLLPTNQTYSKLISIKLETHLSKLADQFLLNETSAKFCSPYKLLYYLQIIEIVCKNQEMNNLSSTWSINLYRLLVTISKNLLCLNTKTNLNSIILLECLLITIRLLSNSLIVLSQTDTNEEIASNETEKTIGETPRKKVKRNSPLNPAKSEADQTSVNFVVSPTQSFIKWTQFKELVKTTDDISMFLSLLLDIQIYVSSFTPDSCPELNNNSSEVLAYTMQFLAICLVGNEKLEQTNNEDTFYTVGMIKDVFFSDNLKPIRINWLKSLFLTEVATNKRIGLQLRKDACNWLYRICILEQQNNNECSSQRPSLLKLTLNELLTMLEMSVKYKPCKSANSLKFNFKDYFILTSNLIRNLDVVSSRNCTTNHLIDMNELMRYISKELRERESYEHIQNGICFEDDVLIGLFSLALSIVKQQQQLISNKNLTFSSLSLLNKPCVSFLDELFDYLFKISCNDFKRAQPPKCRSTHSRTLCFDLLFELCRFNFDSYEYLNKKLIGLHKTLTITSNVNNKPSNSTNIDLNQSYSWDYWPRDESRSACGYVGLINLGATCYMATSMQQLYMISEARECILRSTIKINEETKSTELVNGNSSKINKNTHSYDKMLTELKKMFAFMQESERKAYNPKDFCKVYIMDQQPLNTAEQKDMQEFFTDLISKLEETSNTELKNLIKNLFGGTITNLVISLDCPHVSCTLEEFYTVRCQVAGMKDLYDSLNEITVKDTLEGDNMYTCSKCARKVRAEKRACFRQLPQILCFNTMRYTFNMITMLKEKVNTHFSFPLQLNMSGYMEKNLKPSLPDTDSQNGSPANDEPNENESETNLKEENEEDYLYELIGVTVHTGTAEGGHYYSFIRERNAICSSDGDAVDVDDTQNKSKWYLFNDTEVKPFDAATQLASECFGGETTSKTYDSTSDKFMDLSFEKTNSAYMLFYERTNKKNSYKTVSKPSEFSMETNKNELVFHFKL